MVEFDGGWVFSSTSGERALSDEGRSVEEGVVCRRRLRRPVLYALANARIIYEAKKAVSTRGCRKFNDAEMIFDRCTFF